MMENKIKSGDILFCTGKSLLSKLIMKFTKSNYSHAALAIEVWGEICIIDSQKDGTNLRLLKEWGKNYKYKYDIVRPFSFTTEMKSRAIEKMGFTPYDFYSLVILQPLYLITKRWFGKRGEKAEKRMYCSEFVAYVFGIKDDFEMNPGGLYIFCINSPFFKKIQR